MKTLGVFLILAGIVCFAVSIANQILEGRHYFLIEGHEMDDRKLVRNTAPSS